MAAAAAGTGGLDLLGSRCDHSWVRQLTGCTELTDQTDCSCNVYGGGGYFGCHKDHLALTVLIPLTNPSADFAGGGTGKLVRRPAPAALLAIVA